MSTSALADALDRACLSSPDTRAIATPDGQDVSFGALKRAVDAFAGRLAREGVMPGATICIHMENPAVRLVLIVAALKIGARPALAGSARDQVAAGIPTTATVTLPDVPVAVGRTIAFDQGWFQPGPPTEATAGRAGPGEVIVGTSGTTGTMKFLPLPETVVLARFANFDHALGPASGPALVAPPVQSSFGLTMTMRTLLAGHQVLWPMQSPRVTLDLMARHGTSFIVATPMLMAELLDEIRPGGALPPLRQIMMGGGPLGSGLAVAVADAFPDARVFNFYGASETGPIAMTDITGGFDRPGTIGRPGPWNEVRVVGEGDGAALPTGATGALQVRPEPAFRCGRYFDGDGPFDAGGWFATGDLARILDDGTVVLAGRASERINTGGNKIAPQRFEAAAAGFPGVVDIAVVGVENAHGFEDIGVAVVAAAGFDFDALIRRLDDAAPGRKTFRRLVVPSLPINAAGKLDRDAILRAFAEAGAA